MRRRSYQEFLEIEREEELKAKKREQVKSQVCSAMSDMFASVLIFVSMFVLLPCLVCMFH